MDSYIAIPESDGAYTEFNCCRTREENETINFASEIKKRETQKEKWEIDIASEYAHPVGLDLAPAGRAANILGLFYDRAISGGIYPEVLRGEIGEPIWAFTGYRCKTAGDPRIFVSAWWSEFESNMRKTISRYPPGGCKKRAAKSPAAEPRPAIAEYIVTGDINETEFNSDCAAAFSRVFGE